ncbi:uncharacterized protein LOC115476054 [Microcaecilia unicolor]|uniref:Uncharacterized protein LOC115476054 n=1 Tax=Microcaecilia unicolor TaxID=1415580 RepID=A0A6P7YXN4_9AMPH|nr:uncharacterized protein LOC115476054 [Microcaecilia unicolor]
MSQTKRARDAGRKYLSGSMKRKINKTKKTAEEKQKGALNKYFRRANLEIFEVAAGQGYESVASREEGVLPELTESNRTSQETNDDTEIPQSDHATSSQSRETKETHDMKDQDSPEQEHFQENESLNISVADYENPKSLESLTISDDPTTWPERIDHHLKDCLVKKGPPKILLEEFPCNKNGRYFSKAHCKRKLPNGEIIHRPWVIYSVSANKIFCFYCRIFGNDVKCALTSTGFNQWSNVNIRLAEHEKSKGHLVAMLIQRRLSAEETIDKVQQKLMNKEKKRWHQVMERLVALVQFLSERNLAFCGSVEQLGSSHNGNFLGFIELLGKFDPVIQEHLQRISCKEIHDHYLGKHFQNELIQIMGNAVLNNIIHRIKAAKYFAVILDCTPDISHQQQMSLIIRYVSDSKLPSALPAGVYEHFIKFLDVNSSTGENLYNVLKHELEKLGLDISNIRGLGYDNGANMRGKESGVQARLLQENPRAFFTPRACHNYNLVLGDMAKTCPDAITFFRTLQRLYVIFSASTKRWAVFRKHVRSPTAKPLSDTRWECRIQSVRAVRYQAGNFYDALIEIAEASEDAQARSEAESLANQMKDYKFIVSLVFWYDLLFQVNFVSKELQSKTVDLATALSSFEKLLQWLKQYRETGFEQVLVGATELANDLEVTPEFQTNTLRKRKRHFIYESADNPITDPKEAYKVNCFNQVLDKAMQSLEPRFKQLKKNVDLFGFLSTFQQIPKQELQKYAAELEIALTDVNLIQENDDDVNSDLDGHMLVEEMEALKPILPSSSFGKPLKILEFLALNERATGFPHFCIALRIFLTIPVTVASGERSFSKLKLIKSYPRSNMLQDRLNSLAILSIESEEAKKLKFNKILRAFAEERAKKESEGRTASFRPLSRHSGPF